MNLSRKLLVGVSLAAAMSFASPVLAKTLVYCSEGSPEGFTPALFTSGTTFDASSRAVYNKLVEFKPGTTEIQPGLAESWDISKDGLEYTFHLRKGVKFHTTKWFTPTREFNADDVLFSFNRQRLKDHPYHNVSGGSYEYFSGMGMGDLIKDIVKVDDYTVKFILNRPEAPMIANLAMDFASIQSAEFADKTKDNKDLFDQKPVGTGPFQMVGYRKDSLIRYKANPDYWRGVNPVDTLVFTITPDAAVRYQKMKADECQVMAYPNPADIAEMKKDPNINLMQQEGLNIGYMAYNTQQAPFDNPKVRRALNMAINKQAIIDAVFQGAGKIAKNPIPPTMWSYNNAIEDDKYDPETAKKMLEEAGVKNLSMKLWAMPVQRPYNPNARRMAELMQADFAKVGVNVEIVTYEWGEYLKRSSQVDRDGAALLGWTGDNGDPDNFLGVLLSCDGIGGSNRSQWCNEEFDALIKKAKSVSDVKERTKLYEEAQVVFKREAPWATIAHSVVSEPVSVRVKNYKIDPFGGHNFYGVDLK
ncbi:ABC transporter substrate-binding protein [Polycladidibacter stylochi]|uniref:ABC transporter substrate-binding protein n=1 Tax=Polycladidibacter stylochi TaxID=1807766 RepID=UPI00082A631A|nr:ABC transporter substrate-binding protein [Pseudovibrio stylochi]